MSNWREQLSEESESKAVLAWLEEYYQVPILLFIVGFALWNRIRNWENFIVDGEVILTANDPWYHMRSTEYAVRNFPNNMPFDPWTQFPYGTFTAQFGTLFDQVIAFLALIVGLGSPSQFTTRFVFMVSPAFWVALICIPAYIVGRRIGGRFGGLVAAGFVAFAPDRLLAQGVAGNVQHHPAEALFMALGMLGIMVALTVAEAEKPVYELVAAREFDALRRPIGWSMLAGVAIGLYMWVWPPGVWIYGILGVFFVVHLCIEHVRGRSPEHPAFVGVIALVTSAVMQLALLRSFDLSVTGRSILQPGLGLVVGAGIVFLAWLSREVDSRDLSRYAYPAAVGASILAVVGFVFLALPGLFDFFFGQVDRVLGFITSPGETAGTVGEAQPASSSDFDRWYKLANYTAILGAAVLLVRQVLGDESRGEELLIVVWMAFIVAATFTQIRFGYYLTVPIGALNAALVGFIMQTMGTESSDGKFSIEAYQVITVFVVVLVIFVPMLGLFGVFQDDSSADTVTELADGRSNPGGIIGWKSSLDWMNENTPAEGQYANPDGEKMDLWGEYKLTDDFDYPPGAYGVMSWWDYGHWITGQAERIPNANPFQEGSSTAAEFLLAQDETEAQEVLSTVDESEDAKTRYVMIDWKMVESESSRPLGGKFFAPTAFTDKYNGSEFYTRLLATSQQGQRTISMVNKQPYYNSMVARLYHFHGSAQGPRVPQFGVPVVEWTGTERTVDGSDQTFVEAPRNGTAFRFVDSMEEARNITENNPSAQIGGIGGLPSERVPALENFRLVQMSDVHALGRSQASLTAANEHGLRFWKQRFVRRTIATSGLGLEVGRQVTDDSSLTQREFLQMIRQGTDTATRIERISEQIMFPTTPAWTKVFERVPGATIEGTGGPPNSTVTLRVPIEPENGRSFNYRQRVETDENGEFTATVPYATEGYDEWGPEEGYTNVSARANGSYSVQTGFQMNESGYRIRYAGSVNVTEAQVIGEDTSPAEVELGEQVIPPIQAQPGDGEDSEGGDSGDGGSGDDSQDSSGGEGQDGSGGEDDGGSTGDGSNSVGTSLRPSEAALPPPRARP